MGGLRSVPEGLFRMIRAFGTVSRGDVGGSRAVLRCFVIAGD